MSGFAEAAAIAVIGAIAGGVVVAVGTWWKQRRERQTAHVRFKLDRIERRVYLENHGGADAISVNLSEAHGSRGDPFQIARKGLPARRIKARGGTCPLPVLHELIPQRGVEYVITWRTDAGKEGSYQDVLYPLA